MNMKTTQALELGKKKHMIEELIIITWFTKMPWRGYIECSPRCLSSGGHEKSISGMKSFICGTKSVKVASLRQMR